MRVMIAACPSPAFAFTLLLVSHAVICTKVRKMMACNNYNMPPYIFLCGVMHIILVYIPCIDASLFLNFHPYTFYI